MAGPLNPGRPTSGLRTLRSGQECFNLVEDRDVGRPGRELSDNRACVRVGQPYPAVVEGSRVAATAPPVLQALPGGLAAEPVLLHLVSVSHAAERTRSDARAYARRELAGLVLDQIAFLDAKIVQLASRAAGLAAAMPAAWGVNADGTTGSSAGAAPDARVLNAIASWRRSPGSARTWPARSSPRRAWT